MVSFVKLSYHSGIKLRIYPSNNQKQIIHANINASRFDYNELVAIDKELYMLNKTKLYIKQIEDRKEYLNRLKSGEFGKLLQQRHPWIHASGASAVSLSQAQRRYKDAWNMFRKVHTSGVPVFKRKKLNNAGSYQTGNLYPGVKETDRSITNGANCVLDNKHIKLDLLGRIRVGKGLTRLLNKPFNIRIATVTVSKDTTDKYWVSFQLGAEQPFVDKLTKTNSQIGIDLNTDNFLTTSEGKVVDNPRFYRLQLKRLKREQRKLSRRGLRAKKEGRSIKDSHNYKKQRVLVANLQQDVANKRRTFLDQTSIALIKNHDKVVAEELRSSNMLKNHALAMSISDVGWRSFLSILDYKSSMYGREFVKVNPRNTTQTCSACGFVMGTDGTDKLTLSDREWTCPNCGQYHIRDVNASQNILAKGSK